VRGILGNSLMTGQVLGVGELAVAGVRRLSVRADNPARLMYQQAGFVFMGIDSNNYHRYELRN